METPFISTEWLAAHLDDPNVVVIDGSWYLPAMNRDGYDEYLAAHIPGAVFFDIDGVADKTTGLPHMLLPPDPLVVRLRLTPPTLMVVEALTLVMPAVAEVSVTEHEPVPPVVAQLGAESVPGPLAMAKPIVVPSGALT